MFRRKASNLFNPCVTNFAFYELKVFLVEIKQFPGVSITTLLSSLCPLFPFLKFSSKFSLKRPPLRRPSGDLRRTTLGRADCEIRLEHTANPSLSSSLNLLSDGFCTYSSEQLIVRDGDWVKRCEEFFASICFGRLLACG